MRNMLQVTMSTILTSVIYLVGGYDLALRALLIMITLDYITGVMSAIVNKKLSSKIGFNGFLKKLSYLIIVVMAVVMDTLTNQDGTIRTLVIYFFVANDGISILENVGKMGIPLPKKLKDCLLQLKGDEIMEEKNVEILEETVTETVEEVKEDTIVESVEPIEELHEVNIEVKPMAEILYEEPEVKPILNEEVIDASNEVEFIPVDNEKIVKGLEDTICLQTIVSEDDETELG